jgi:hypothetical protein
MLLSLQFQIGFHLSQTQGIMKKAMACLLIISQVLISCGKAESSSQTEAPVHAVSAAPQTSKGKAFARILQLIPVKEIPRKDTVDWSACEEGKVLSEELIRQLSLSTIMKPGMLKRTSLLYRLNLSDRFYALVAAYCPSEMEMENHLLLYSTDGLLLDHLLVSSDELAEGAVYGFSLLNPDGIEKHAFNEFDEARPETVTAYQISEKGKIIRTASR